MALTREARATGAAAPRAKDGRGEARLDRRTRRTRRALRDALAQEIRASGGLDRVSVTALTQRADVTRRTFYSHYHDIADLVECSEAEFLRGLVQRISPIEAVTLDRLEECVARAQPCPGSVELLEYVRDHGDYLGAMLGPGGDPALVEKIRSMVVETVTDRAMDGLAAVAAGPFFDYYLSFCVCAELGVLQRWLEGGMREDVCTMALTMTMLMFVRPGDLYGRPIDIDLPSFALGVALAAAGGRVRGEDAGASGDTSEERTR